MKKIIYYTKLVLALAAYAAIVAFDIFCVGCAFATGDTMAKIIAVLIGAVIIVGLVFAAPDYFDTVVLNARRWYRNH